MRYSTTIGSDHTSGQYVWSEFGVASYVSLRWSRSVFTIRPNGHYYINSSGSQELAAYGHHFTGSADVFGVARIVYYGRGVFSLHKRMVIFVYTLMEHKK